MVARGKLIVSGHVSNCIFLFPGLLNHIIEYCTVIKKLPVVIPGVVLMCCTTNYLEVWRAHFPANLLVSGAIQKHLILFLCKLPIFGTQDDLFLSHGSDCWCFKEALKFGTSSHASLELVLYNSFTMHTT